MKICKCNCILWQSANKLLDFLNWGNFLPLFCNVHQCPSIVEAAFATWLIWECCETPGHFCLVISLHTNHAMESRISLSVWWLTWCLQQYLWYYYYHSQTFVRDAPYWWITWRKLAGIINKCSKVIVSPKIISPTSSCQISSESITPCNQFIIRKA